MPLIPATHQGLAHKAASPTKNPNWKETTMSKSAAAAKPPSPEAEERSPKIRIVSLVNGFRRAGVAHSTAPVDYEAGAFTLEQFEALKAETNLIVELL